MRKVLALIVLVLAACGGTEPASTDIPDEIRDQLHAASGHELGDCTDLRSESAVIQITPDGFAPACAIVSIDQSVLVRNTQSTDDTWVVADPENNLVPRHIRILLEIPAGAEAPVERIGEWAPSGVWPCYGRESRHQCQLVIVP